MASNIVIEQQLKDAFENYKQALRAFEAAHARWMETSVFDAGAFAKAKEAKDDAMREYSNAVERWYDAKWRLENPSMERLKVLERAKFFSEL